jgi:signal peptidase I
MQNAKKYTFLQVTARLMMSAVLCFLIILVITQVFFPKQAINLLGFRTFLVANTKSMEPMLKANDLIVVKKFDFDKLQEGDLVSFESKGNIITHEVVGSYTHTCGTKSFVTRGMNRRVVGGVDAPMTIDGRRVTCTSFNGDTNKYIGKVALTNRPLGNAFSFVASLPALMMIIVNTIGFILIIQIAKSMKKKEEVIHE